jgi:hypothetical protein
MILDAGDRVLIAYRRLFDHDEPRYFLGRVDAYEDGVLKTTGRTYARDPSTGRMIAKADVRTKIVSIASGTLIVYQLPDDVALDRVRFESLEGRITATDGAGFTMNLTEHAHDGEL